MKVQDAIDITNRKIDDDNERINDLAMEVKKQVDMLYQDPSALFHELKMLMESYDEIQTRLDKFRIQMITLQAVTEV